MVTRHNTCGVSPFGHPGINARLSTPPGLSQIPTSFIGSQCQGIHHAPLKTYKHKKLISKEQTQNKHKKQSKKWFTRFIAENNNHTQKCVIVRCSRPLYSSQTTTHTPHTTTRVTPRIAVSSVQTPKTTPQHHSRSAGLLFQAPIMCHTPPDSNHPHPRSRPENPKVLPVVLTGEKNSLRQEIIC